MMVNVKRNDPRRRNPRPARAVALARLIEREDLACGVELGVFKGETLFYLLDRFPDLAMVGVDSWEFGPADDSVPGARSYSQFPLEDFAHEVCQAAESYGPRCAVVRKDTAEAARDWPDRQFDFVFIDGDHTYDGVSRDILAWLPKAAPGGWMLGHDLDFPSVRDAVEHLLPNAGPIGETCWGVKL